LYADPAPTAAFEPAAAERWRAIADRVLVVERHLNASRADVWRPLTTEAGLRAWWWSHWNDVEITADARPGGSYRFTAPDAGIRIEGSYLDVDPDEHLAFTWRWTDADGTSADEACDIVLTEVDGGTSLALRHTGPWPDDAPAESYRQGWEFCWRRSRASSRADEVAHPADRRVSLDMSLASIRDRGFVISRDTLSAAGRVDGCVDSAGHGPSRCRVSGLTIRSLHGTPSGQDDCVDPPRHSEE